MSYTFEEGRWWEDEDSFDTRRASEVDQIIERVLRDPSEIMDHIPDHSGTLHRVIQALFQDINHGEEVAEWNNRCILEAQSVIEKFAREYAERKAA